MTQKQKELFIKDLCARLPYDLIVQETFQNAQRDVSVWDCGPYYIKGHPEKVKPYLRSMKSMTEEEARKIAELSGFLAGSENILSISVKEEFIDIKIDDGVCSTETRTLWFTEMPTSIALFDYLNAHHFDYRGLIPMGIALEAPENMYK